MTDHSQLSYVTTSIPKSKALFSGENPENSLRSHFRQGALLTDYGSFRAGAQPPWLSPWESWHGEAVTERAVPAAAGDSPCHFVALPPHKWGGKNGAQLPWLSLWGSWHGEAVTEEAFPAAAGGSPCHCVALPPHKCGGQERGEAPLASHLGELARQSRD